MNAVKIAQSTTAIIIKMLQAHALQDEYEDNALLYQQLQDNLATEMFTFVAGERRCRMCDSSVLTCIVFKYISFIFLVNYLYNSVRKVEKCYI